MARPNKPDDQLRTIMFRMRLSPSEKQLIDQNAKAAGLTPSDYLRGFGVSGGVGIGAKPERTVPTRDREALLKTLAEQNKIGSNLNQIARVLNSLKEDGDMRGISADHVHEVLYGIDLFRKLLMDQLK